MKKLALVMVAMLTMVFTGCKTENSTVTVYVENVLENPVAQRAVVYADLATIIIDAVLPSPESLATDIPEGWSYVITDASGKAVIPITLSVSKMDYVFEVYDYGKQQWISQTKKLQRGVNDAIEFKVQN